MHLLRPLLSKIRIPSREERQWHSEARRHLRLLTQPTLSKRQEAAQWFQKQGERGTLVLERALGKHTALSCGAGYALAEQGNLEGILRILRGCTSEDWLLYYPLSPDYSPLHEESGTPLLRLSPISPSPLQYIPSRHYVTALRQTTLALPESESREAYLECLGMILVTLKILFNMDSIAEEVWCEFLHLPFQQSPPGIKKKEMHLVQNTVWNIREYALFGLVKHCKEQAYPTLETLFHAEEAWDKMFAIYGFKLLHSKQAVPLLETIAFQPKHPLARYARDAIAVIAGASANPLTLLRPASDPESEQLLLRPALDVRNTDTDSLLRPL
ncbi:MAG: hypothetical protein NT023_24210 [Armatimonadetes bacterium]|nr:hypothetical protein [Armatimonadota bacterium]